MKTKHLIERRVSTELKNKIDLCNRLLEEIDFDDDSMEMQDKIEELCAFTDDEIGILSCEFDDGCYLTIDIASGNHNYYDNIVLFDENGNEIFAKDVLGRKLITESGLEKIIDVNDLNEKQRLYDLSLETTTKNTV